ncbi:MULTISPECIES: sec-independent translocase [unclassified Crossiella]|uniref:sec-independent translocase n=1 Tax=unclassified Crossiella TaxID=2620835 RepID=UPI00207C377E|nr:MULTISPECIES: sec-independent translocase [unclassified Crossiella]MCO1576958.1 sec-independent translocase [Crossiella sp. SN42]WHT18585.1 sec-independent translocase [Crossiella sp. CA-258035]
MFESIGWAEILVLIVAGLFILGPERLPEAAAWLGKTLRKVREYATGAREQLKSEIGPEFEEFRKPLEDLRKIRDFDPRRAVTKHLLNDVEDDFHHKPNGHAPSPAGAPVVQPPVQRPLGYNERPPFDPDAT